MAWTKLSWSHSMSSPLIPGNSMFSFILTQSYPGLLKECMRISLLVRQARSEGLAIEVNNRFLPHVGPQHLVCSTLGENMLETILKSLLCWLSSSKNQIARNLSIKMAFEYIDCLFITPPPVWSWGLPLGLEAWRQVCGYSQSGHTWARRPSWGCSAPSSWHPPLFSSDISHF